MTKDLDAGARRGSLIVALLILAMVHLGFLVLSGAEPFKYRSLRGADSYSRLVQVQEMVDHGDWFQPRLPRSNTPYGEIRIWTRAFDIVLWLGAEALSPFLGFRDALYVWSSLSGTALQLLAALALFWAARPLLAGEAWICLAVLLPFQASMLVQFLPGRPDHHGIQALFFVVIWGCALRLAAGRQDRRLLAAAALASAGALWLSVEALIVIAMLLAVVSASWMLGRMQARSVLILCAVLAALSALVLAIERPPAHWMVEDFDRISIVHCWLFVLIAAFWLLAWRLELQGLPGRGIVRRGGLALVGALAVAFLLWLGYPSVLGGPMVQVPADVLVLWQQHIAEFKPAIDPDSAGESTFRILTFIGLAPLAIVYLPFLIWRANPSARAGWYVTGLGLLLYLPLALYQIRWGIYAQFLTLPVLAAALGQLASRLDGLGLGARTISKFGLLLLVACGPLAFGWSMHSEPAPATTASAGTDSCDTRAISAFLMQPEGLGDRPRSIMGFIFSGPELLYRTRHHVVATPDHRNAEGIADTAAFFSASDDATARAIAKRRGIELVLFCVGDAERAYYQRPGGRDLLDRLIAGKTPAWLAAVSLPEGLHAYRLYRIVD